MSLEYGIKWTSQIPSKMPLVLGRFHADSGPVGPAYQIKFAAAGGVTFVSPSFVKLVKFSATYVENGNVIDLFHIDTMFTLNATDTVTLSSDAMSGVPIINVDHEIALRPTIKKLGFWSYT